MFEAQNRMSLVFAKMNMNSHRAFVNVMANVNDRGRKREWNVKRGKCKDNNDNVYKYVQRLKYGMNHEDISNVKKEKGNMYYHHKCKSIEELVRKDTNERIKYKINTHNNNEINGCIPYNS